MNTDEVFRMLEEARKLNFVAYLAWGGEPLMRPDAVKILKHAHDLGFYTSFITNGTFLSENVREIANTVDLTWVSLDHFSDYHDELRGLEGAFSRAVNGITKVRQAGKRVAINCVLSKLNADALPGMAELARHLGVKLAFDPMEVFPGINEEYALSRAEYGNLFLEVLRLKNAGFPILNSYDYLEHMIHLKKYSCAQPRIFINVSENGKVTPFWCKKTNHILGDVRKQSLGGAIYSAAFKEFAKMTDGCSLCSNSSTVETSMFYSDKVFFKNCFRIPSQIINFIMQYAL